MAQASDALPEATNVRRVILWLNMPALLAVIAARCWLSYASRSRRDLALPQGLIPDTPRHNMLDTYLHSAVAALGPRDLLV
jgi:hypothetical protein